MMTDQKYIYTVICLYLCSRLHVISTESTGQECDKSKCPGPIAYYEELKCTPIYETVGDCCAVRYNCDNLKGRSADKCYWNGHVYNIGENLRDEDARPCDIGCTCSTGYDGRGTFNCAIVDCFAGPPHPGCYRKRSPLDCCPGEEVCPENPQSRAQCVVDGRTYLDGESFTPDSDPTLDCSCQPGYEGRNVEPFCRSTASLPGCGIELRYASDIHNNCTPVYYSNQSPTTDCSVFSRCQNDKDIVVRSEVATRTGVTSVSDPDSTCVFGNLTMNRGDELNQATDYNSVCVKCVCEVPPMPTCQRLPDNECDVTVHPPFHNFT